MAAVVGGQNLMFEHAGRFLSVTFNQISVGFESPYRTRMSTGSSIPWNLARNLTERKMR
jgi:hypothetical protein